MDKMDKIYIIDSWNYENSHEIFNAAFLKICQHISNDIYYFASASSIKCVKYLVNDIKNVTFNNIPVVRESPKIFIVFKYLLSALINILKVLTINKDSLIIFNHNINILALYIINQINKIAKRKILIFCHGELECLSNNFRRDWGLRGKFDRKMVRSFFLNKKVKLSDNISFIVLSGHILVNLKSALPVNIVKNFYVINHPIIFFSKMRNESVHNSINFGIIGRGNKDVAIKNIILLSRKFSREIEKGILTFFVNTDISIDPKLLIDNKIDYRLNKNGLNRDEYNKRLSTLDYVLFFYDSYLYNFTVSGAIFDAIIFEKPIIALRNNYFEYLFDKFPSLGILADNIDDMATIIKQIVNKEYKKEYSFDIVKQNFSPEAITPQFQHILERIYS
jgi:hypothetical protein